jgi:carbamoyltransferase
MNILGLSGGTAHDPAACLVHGGSVVAMVEEERLSRVKHAHNQLPIRSILFCLSAAGIAFEELDCIAVSWDPGLDPRQGYLREYVGRVLSHEAFRTASHPPIEYVHHHLAHAASSFFASGYPEAAVIVVDGAGENVSTSIGFGRGTVLNLEQRFGIAHSLGHFFGFATEHSGLGYGDAGKLMGLAAYGERGPDVDPIKLEADGYHVDFAGISDDLPADELFGALRERWREWLTDHFGSSSPATYSWDTGAGKIRRAFSLSKAQADLAATVQSALCDTLIHLSRIAVQRYNTRRLVLAGGVALNCGANGAIRDSGVVDDLFIVPPANDAGGALGAALYIAANSGGAHSLPCADLGPGFSDGQCADLLRQAGIGYGQPANVAEYAADLLAGGAVIGWFQGRMEVGPRALGQRSILSMPDKVELRDRVNRIKHREAWRPLSPSVLATAASEYFTDERPSPFMLLAKKTTEDATLTIPGVVHADGTARPQTVTPTNGVYFDLLRAVRSRTGIGAVLNTSFNLEDEPIVCTPGDALRTFILSDLDALVLGNLVVEKEGRARRCSV